MKIKHGFKGERFLIVPYSQLLTMAKNPLVGSVYIHSLGHFSNAKHHYIDRPNGRKEYVCIYCTAGKGWVCVDGERFDIEENQLIIIAPNVPHSYGADERNPWSIYWIHILGPNAHLYVEGFERPITISPNKSSRIEDRLSLFEEIYNVLYDGFTYENICYANICLQHFLATFMFIKQYRAAKKRAEYSCNAINLVIYYMHEKITSKLTISELAIYAGYSESYLYRVFIKETGCPPIEYFNRMKVHKSCEYLLHSSMKIVQISNILGFNDPYYFSRTFSRVIGVSPMRFRKMNGVIESETAPI